MELLAYGDIAGSRYVTSEQVLPENVEAFRGMIGREIVDARVINAPELDTKTFDTNSAVDAVAKAIGGGYGKLGRLYTGSEAHAQEVSGLLQSAPISRTITAETSAHQVFFGKLVGPAGEARVAVKPFTKRDDGNTAPYRKVIQEWANTNAARSRGFGAFAPIGFIPTSEGGYMITERRDDVDPMDGVDWEGALNDPDREDLITELKEVAPLLANLHHNGITHGDPQIKNFVIDQRGAVDAIDFESAHIQPHGEQPADTDGLLRRTRRDLIVLFSSLARGTADAGIGLLSNMTPQAQLSYYKELVLNPYVETRLKLMEDVADETQHESVIELLGTLEEDVVKYIEDGELQRSLSRARNRMGE